MKAKLPFEEQAIKDTLAIYLKEIVSIEIWRNFIKRYPNIINENEEIYYLEELDIFSLHYKSLVIEHKNSELTIIKRWNFFKGNYPMLFKLARAFLAIPYSTSKVESVFSEFKAFKTSYRNRLTVENLEASILCEQYFRANNPRILPDMVDRYTELWTTKEN